MYSSNPYPSNPSNRNPWRILAIVFIILFAFALAMWIYTTQSDTAKINYCQSQYNNLQSQYHSLQSQYNNLSNNYTTLKSQYNNLQSQYNSLQSQYTNLESNYTTLKNQYNTLQSQYQALQSQYSSLQSQYQALQSQYSSLQSQYHSLQSQYSTLSNNYTALKSQYATLKENLTTLNSSVTSLLYALYSLGTGSSHAVLSPGYFYYMYSVVPSGLTGAINITMYSTNPLRLYVFSPSEFIEWVQNAGSPSSYIYYQNGDYVNYTLYEGPGLYFIVIYNPTNSDVLYSLTVTTTYRAS